MGRILELEPTGETFTDTFPDAPPLEMELPAAHPPVTVKLRFSPTVAFRVFDEFDRRDITPQPDGSLTVTSSFPLDGWVYGYLLTYGAEVDILEPPELRMRIADLSRNIYEHHKT